MTHKLIPLGNDCVIVPIEESDKVASGLLYKPSTAKKKVNNGIVIAKGSLVSSEIEISDHVMFNGRSGDQISMEDSGRFFVIPESHIIAKLVATKVRLVDTETVKRVIEERVGELRTIYKGSNMNWADLQHDLNSRIDSLTIAEGFEF